MLDFWLVKKLSRQTTSCPCRTRRSQRCEPRNPVPPVTSIRLTMRAALYGRKNEPSAALGAGPRSVDEAAMTSPPSSALRLVIGAMTGTSIDGIDAALVAIEGAGLGLRAELVAQTARTFPEALAKRLRAAAEQTPLS